MHPKAIVFLVMLICTGLMEASCAAGSGAISVKDYGAKGDGATDDTAAIQAAANAAVITRSEGSTVGMNFQNGPALVFPEGKYMVSGAISLNVLEVRGIGRPIIAQTNAGSDIFVSATAWRMSIRNITFSGGRTHIDLSNPPAEGGQIVIDHCRFYGSSGFAIKTNTPAASVKINDCTLNRVYQAWLNEGTEHASMRDCWVFSGTAANKAVIEHRGEMMLLDNICGVPDASAAGRRWLDNYGEWLVLRRFRAGGENGGMMPVYNYRKYSNTLGSTDPGARVSSIIVDDCYICPGGGSKSCAVYCYEVPNMISIRDTTFFPGTGIILDPDLNMEDYFEGAPTHFSYSVEDCMGEWIGELPSALVNPVPPLTPQLTGAVVIEGYTGDKADVAVRVELIQGSTVVRADRVVLDNSGRFSLLNVTPGVYNMAIKSYASGKKEMTGVLISGYTDIGTVVLSGGDLDGNSVVNSADIGVVLPNLDRVGE